MNTYVKWLCWQKGCKLSFESRWVFSVACDLYFRQKKMPSLRRIKKIASVRHSVAKRCLSRLTEEGLLKNGVPQYKPDTFFEKANFMVKRWWKGLHYRKIEPTGLGKRADVIFAFVVRANSKKATIGPSYLVACTGILKRTVNHIIARMMKANKLKKDGTTLLALIEEKGVTMTVADNQGQQIKMMLGDCHDTELRKQLILIGLRAYSVLFKNYQRISKANKGQMSYRHLLNAIKQQQPELVEDCLKGAESM